MQKKTIQEIQENYELELDKAINNIKKQKAKIVLLQFPEGMKAYSQAIADEIELKTNALCIIWFGTCFGACDIPLVDNITPKIDLVIQFGHSAWNYNDNKENIGVV
ncbi:MAG: diphthamide synthesis protein [Candidatus Nanoarchaeia archaeon]